MHNKQKNIISIEDFENIKNLFILQKLHKLTIQIKNSSLHLNLWNETINFYFFLDNATY